MSGKVAGGTRKKKTTTYQYTSRGREKLVQITEQLIPNFFEIIGKKAPAKFEKNPNRHPRRPEEVCWNNGHGLAGSLPAASAYRGFESSPSTHPVGGLQGGEAPVRGIDLLRLPLYQRRGTLRTTGGVNHEPKGGCLPPPPNTHTPPISDRCS